MQFYSCNSHFIFWKTPKNKEGKGKGEKGKTEENELQNGKHQLQNDLGVQSKIVKYLGVRVFLCIITFNTKLDENLVIELGELGYLGGTSFRITEVGWGELCNLEIELG